MTTTYDPAHPAYLDEADVRGELTRVFGVCDGCRNCLGYCSSFPSLFELVGRHDDGDPGRLTPAQQDRVVDECFHCQLCQVNCPYTPGAHDWAIDFPRLMQRVQAMRRATGQVARRTRWSDQLWGRTDLIGGVASRFAPTANKVVGAEPGSLVRKAVEKVSGVSAVRLLPPFARQRFTTWFAQRPKVRIARRQGRVAVFPTCLVEYQQPQIGHDLVKVYERNGVECKLADGAACCGAPWLDSGDVEQFAKVAAKNVRALARAVRKGQDIVVPQPTCGYVLRREYPVHVPSDDSRLVAEHTFDAAEYLMRLHKADDTTFDLDFSGFVPHTVTYHTPCHLKAQNIGLKSRDLIKLTGARVVLVQQCSGVDGRRGWRVENTALSLQVAGRLGEAVRAAGGDAVAGDCHLANTVIAEQTGESPLHPLQIVARAYGIPEEGERV